ncbi:MAG: DUF2817 domain-containing protein [Planctomycetes bacterium]|nr:DUF2817 domain-containing protein [Planctomycetota bacterium]
MRPLTIHACPRPPVVAGRTARAQSLRRRWPAAILALAVLAGCRGSVPAAPGAGDQATAAEFAGRTAGVPEFRPIGHSLEGRPILAAEFGRGGGTALVVSGVHGDERSAIRVGQELCRRLAAGAPPLGRRVVVVPVLNPDGAARGRRANARGVDLNRNLPTRNWADVSLRRKDDPGAAPASEPETAALLALVERLRPDRIVAIHAAMKVNNYDGPGGLPLARRMAEHNRYPVRGAIGYPTPGSFGTWAGVERGIPMVTLEVEAGARAWDRNAAALLDVLLQ